MKSMQIMKLGHDGLNLNIWEKRDLHATGTGAFSINVIRNFICMKSRYTLKLANLNKTYLLSGGHEAFSDHNYDLIFIKLLSKRFCWKFVTKFIFIKTWQT